ncbi:BadF/BadG/BcrA/BcrD ATPase family protein [Massilia sp. BJB1822]|uniref:BadF/BadG/BcrA/BcrD ATPase family protein n=1 Tax=Massilia sp. BJB1822 TaxID=2744470 RepID=UPI00159355B2|nr:BadF/BadG/BcrA/BcrD ATPase family protein [Massilia sp. BJB1822]NVD96604.1 ATPase [Massilia sp. BJB1822]
MLNFASDGVLGLGIDAGGTQTRWALADPAGAVVAEGRVEGLSALQLSSAAGRESVRAAFAALAAEVLEIGRPGRVCAGLTGFGGDSHLPAGWLADLLALPAESVSLCNDIEIAYLDCFEPGQGYLVYAGTGSIAAFIDEEGAFHRAGGRGVVLDDGGGGFWIAREAMRRIWRREDEQPGAWQDSPLAQAVFRHVGGSDWTFSRQFIYGLERGEVGKLALAVAASADADAAARNILQQAGRELARLALALVARFGERPVLLSGRASELHPLIAESMRAALPEDQAFEHRPVRPHVAAARMAARPRN